MIRMNDAEIVLFLDFGQGHADKTKQAFDLLVADRENIEKAFGAPLEWDYQPTRRSQYVRKRFNSGGLSTEATWPTLQDEMIEAMIRFDKVLRPTLAKINV